MIVQYGEISNNHNSGTFHKYATTNVPKAAAKRFILMQITRAKAANTFL
jgi:hypothetical protein